MGTGLLLVGLCVLVHVSGSTSFAASVSPLRQPCRLTILACHVPLFLAWACILQAAIEL